MTTTVATLATNIVNRLNTGSATVEPSTTYISQWIRDGFREGFAAFQPPFKSTGTITSDAVAVSGADRILYVLVDGLVLIEGLEWQHGSAGVSELPRRYATKTATIYYTAVPDLTGATIESSCVMGDDWLEPYVTEYAVAQAYQRLSNASPSQAAQTAGGQFRLAMEARTALAQLMQAQRAQWEGRFEQALNRRLMLGVKVRRDHAFSGFLNKGGMYNPLTEAQS